MATGKGNIGYDAEGYIIHDLNDEKKSDDLDIVDNIPGVASSAQRIPYINVGVCDEIKKEFLYTDKITGINPTAEINPYVSNTKFAITAYNPDIENTSGAYWEPAAEIKWYKNANNVLYKQKEELKLEIKVYKKIIKNLLKKQS
jgi:hypothetical protein